MLSWGLLVIVVNVVYLLLSMLIGYLAYKFFKDKYKHIGKIVFIVVLLAPFWDLIIQKSVKTYYQAFKMEGEIYAYPELDADGKIESLDLTNSDSGRTISHFINYEKIPRNKRIFENIGIDEFKIDNFEKYDFDERIKNFLELKVFDSENKEKYIRIRFDEIKPQFEFIENGNARYKIKKKSEKYLFDLYTVNEYLLIDNKTGNILAKDMSVDFKKGSKSKLRNKILLWKSANDSAYFLESIKESEVLRKVLKINKIGR
jgi:hypothetical protein